MKQERNERYVVTAGATYLDIDAYACMVAMAELLTLMGKDAVAYSSAPTNYSVTPSLLREGQVLRMLPEDGSFSEARIVVVDVSDPDFLGKDLPLDCVRAVYDHHAGFEGYWQERIGAGAHIEFIGAAATLILREWRQAGLEDKMTRETAELLAAAILDNTLYLSSANTTQEDRDALFTLCSRCGMDDARCASYFAEVQKSIEADLESAILKDVKHVGENPVLPPTVGQLAVFDAQGLLHRLPEICRLFDGRFDGWMLNVIDVGRACSYFVCKDALCKQRIGKVFGVSFEGDVARTERAYLRKEILKKTVKV